LEKALSDGKGDQVSILCTQPRRVAAISVAERVSEEWGEKSVGKLVGYQIRMEAKRSSETRLLFCTTGVILRRLIEDPDLKGISHVVVDEVHERQVRLITFIRKKLMPLSLSTQTILFWQWQIDVLLVSLRALINGSRPDLKVVLVRVNRSICFYVVAKDEFRKANFISIPHVLSDVSYVRCQAV
jgi:hypothetical protein